ncbi:MAG: type II secretion system protein GspE, partial [Sphingomonas sp.]
MTIRTGEELALAEEQAVQAAILPPPPNGGVADLPQVTIPYLFARRFGVVVQAKDTDGHLTIGLREGADPK